MRVLQIVSQLNGGGAERVALSLVDGLLEAGIPARVVGFYPPGKPVLPVLERIVRDHCDVLGKSPGADLSIYGRLMNVIRRFKPDILHCHLGVLKYVWPVTIRMGPVPIVHTIHSLARFDATPATRTANAFAFHCGGVIPVAVAEAVAASVRSLYHVRTCRVIYNGVYAGEPSVGRSEWRARNGIAPSSFVFVCVGSLAPPKAPLRILTAFATAFPRTHDVELVYLGDGPLRAALTERVAELGLQRRVHLMGFRADVPDAFAAADVLVHCSDLEGDPLAIKEAMFAGLPVIAAGVGGIPEVVENGTTGYLYSARDTGALASLMTRSVSDGAERQRMGVAARKTAQNRFSVARMTEEYAALYTEAAAGKPRAKAAVHTG